MRSRRGAGVSDAPQTPPAAPAGTAGALLRRAREKQGLHIAALAAQIKVSPRKLEALEADRYDELPDATFTRALAQTVCRTLKVDPAPVLALMPQPGGHRLEQVSEGINAPFRDDGRVATGSEWVGLLRPAVVLPLLVLAGAVALWLLPAGTLTSVPSAEQAASAVAALVPSPPAASAPAVVSTPVLPNVPAAASAVPSVPAPSSASAPAAAVVAEAPPLAVAPAATLQVRASAASWVEVVDAGGQSLISRIVAAGETVDLDGALPLKLRIGNAGGTQVSFRGQPVDLAVHTRENVARFELK
jgi:cytoskeleton protein RodZ